MLLKVFPLNNSYLLISVKDTFARYILTELPEAPYSLSWITNPNQIDILSFVKTLVG